MLLAWRLGRCGIVRPRRQGLALLCGPSTSPLEAMQEAVPMAPPASPPSLPQVVKTAAWLLWLSVAIGICRSVYLFTLNPHRTALAAALVVVVVGAAYCLYAWLILTIRRGRNWARVLFVTLVTLGCLSIMLRPDPYFSRGPATAVISVIQAILQISAASLLFSGAARPWFQKR